MKEGLKKSFCFCFWMIHTRKLNKKINKVHERALRIVYGDHKTSFLELLNIDKSVLVTRQKLILSINHFHKNIKCSFSHYC